MKLLFWVAVMSVSLTATEIKTHLHLHIMQGGLLCTKIIHTTLAKMGFKANVNRYRNQDGTVDMDLLLNGRKPYDPKLFAEMLREHQIVVEKGQLQNKQWMVTLDASNTVWNIPAISEDEGAQMERSLVPYWFQVNKAHAISIEAPYGIKWYPDVAVLDANMQVLASYREFKDEDRLVFELPQNSMYLKVSNASGMKILKEGMWVDHATDER